MKKIIIAFMLVFATLAVVKAQEVKVPESIQTKFKNSYTEASAVNWQQVSDKYKVLFTDSHNLHHTLVYTKDGKVFSRESELDEKSVPQAIKDYFVKNLSQEETYRVWKIEDESGKVSFYAPVKEGVIFFDKDGKFDRREDRTPQNIDEKLEKKQPEKQ